MTAGAGDGPGMSIWGKMKGRGQDLATGVGYAELCVTSNFTFLTGASHPEEIVARAAELGLEAVAITDRNSLAGVVRAHAALREIARGIAAGGPVVIRGQAVQGEAGAAAVPLPRLIIGARLA